jgi:hypothetical protein
MDGEQPTKKGIGMREWNPLWHDPEGDANAEYLAAIKRLMIASVNWVEAHPNFKPQYRERDKRDLMRQAGIPDDVDESTVAIGAAWEDVYQPSNSFTRDWFRAMERACSNGDPKGGPSSHMMGKGIAAGLLVARNGWDEFNQFMLSEPSGGTADG